MIGQLLKKTMKAAGRSARLMIDDQPPVAELLTGDSDRKKHQSDHRTNPSENPNAGGKPYPNGEVREKKDKSGGVIFERSSQAEKLLSDSYHRDIPADSSIRSSTPDSSDKALKLKRVREYARQQERERQKKRTRAEEKEIDSLKNFNSEPEQNRQSQTRDLHFSPAYSIKDFTSNSNSQTPDDVSAEQSSSDRPEDGANFKSLLNSVSSQMARPGRSGKPLLPLQSTTSLTGRWQPDSILYRKPDREPEQKESGLSAKLREIEERIDSSWASLNPLYGSYPAVRQLLSGGVEKSVVRYWVEEILKKGIDPLKSPAQFNAGLIDLIKSSIPPLSDKPFSRHLLFAGRSAAGKTTMIMRLALNSRLFDRKSLAIASVLSPEARNSEHYTLLEPFCRKHQIDWFPIGEESDLNSLMNRWSAAEHILIDTPSLDVRSGISGALYRKLGELPARLDSIEVHQVINASSIPVENSEMLANGGHSDFLHPLPVDYLAISNLDRAPRLGAVLMQMKKYHKQVRFISRGKGSPESIEQFQPDRFIRQLISEA